MAEARVPMVLAALTAAIDGLLDAEPLVLAEGDTVLALLGELSRLELVAAQQAVAFEASPEWVDDGAYNGTSWVTAKRRCPRSAARRRLRLGAAMRHLPLVEAAWRRGLIDPDHVEVLMKTRNPQPRRRVAPRRATAGRHRHRAALPKLSPTGSNATPPTTPKSTPSHNVNNARCTCHNPSNSCGSAKLRSRGG
jgi:hypothetical protein